MDHHRLRSCVPAGPPPGQVAVKITQGQARGGALWATSLATLMRTHAHSILAPLCRSVANRVVGLPSGHVSHLSWSHSVNPARRRLCAATSLAAPVRTRECSNSALRRGAGGGLPRHVVSLESRGGTLSVPAAPCCRGTRHTSQSSPWVRSVTVSHSRNFTRCNVRSVLPCHAPVCDITSQHASVAS